MQLKAKIKKMSNDLNVTPQLVLQNYVLECLLRKISISNYKNNFIFKGGFVISSIVGISARTTMDLDTTVKSIDLNISNLYKIFSEIIKIDTNDCIIFEIIKITDIRESEDYPGYRLSFKANYDPISVPLTVDVTCGDIITPKEIRYKHHSIFNDNDIEILTYNIETILSEKIETILTRNIANTRLRDFYDIYILLTINETNINYSILYSALLNTTKKRNSIYILNNYTEILSNVLSNSNINKLWESYSNIYPYAKDIKLEQIITLLLNLLNNLFLNN